MKRLIATAVAACTLGLGVTAASVAAPTSVPVVAPAPAHAVTYLYWYVVGKSGSNLPFMPHYLTLRNQFGSTMRIGVGYWTWLRASYGELWMVTTSNGGSSW
jgi:hypothetical protein